MQWYVCTYTDREVNSWFFGNPDTGHENSL